MPANTSTFNDNPPNMGGMTDKVSDVANQMKDKVADFGRSAADKIDGNRESAASGLENAASALHDKADSLPGGEKVTSLAHTTAEKLNSTAQYVREHDFNRMMGDLEQVVKNNPGPSLIAAAVIGYLAGRAFSED